MFGVAAGLGCRMYSVKNSLRSFLEPQVTNSFKDIQLATTAVLAANLYWH